MQTTENIGLKKPGENDFYSIDDSNENMDIIDEEMKKLQSAESVSPILPETPLTRTNIADGDSLGTMLAKIKKWLSDLKAGAFAAIANNCTTTASGSVLDARQGKALKETIDTVNTSLTTTKESLKAGAFAGIANNCTTTASGSVLDARQGKKLQDQITEQNNNLGGLTFCQDAEGNWGYKPSGADSVIPFKSCDLEDTTLVGSVHISPLNAVGGNTKTGEIKVEEDCEYGMLLISAFADSNGTCANNTYSISDAEIVATFRTGLPSYSNTEAIMLVLKDIKAGEHTITCYNPNNNSSSVNYRCSLYGC